MSDNSNFLDFPWYLYSSRLSELKKHLSRAWSFKSCRNDSNLIQMQIQSISDIPSLSRKPLPIVPWQNEIHSGWRRTFDKTNNLTVSRQMNLARWYTEIEIAESRCHTVTLHRVTECAKRPRQCTLRWLVEGGTGVEKRPGRSSMNGNHDGD